MDYSFEIGPIRPPSEATSLLVRASRNCPWNRCRFCLTYKHAKFEPRSVEDVKADLDNMAKIAAILNEKAEELDSSGRLSHQVLEKASEAGVHPEYAYQIALFLQGGGKKVFLQDGNSLEMPSEDICAIIEHIYECFPSVDCVTTYTRSMTLYKLGQEKLQALKNAGLTRVHVGLESGSDEVLKHIRKGVLSKHHILGGRAAMRAGLELSEYVMPGVAGKELSEQNALQTAKAINEIDPDFIRLRSFFPLPGTELCDQINTGELELPSEDELVKEIGIFIENLDGISSQLYSDHDRNLLMEVEGKFPEDKQAMLQTINSYLSMPDNDRQTFRIGRRLGHFRYLSDFNLSNRKEAAEIAVKQLESKFGDADEGLLKVIDIRL